MNDYRSQRQVSFGPGLSGSVLMLLLWNGILFLLQEMLPWRVTIPMGFRSMETSALTWYFGLRPDAFWHGAIWQVVTYMFLHGGFQHILLNMLGLWMFGSQLEAEWGSRTFLKYYFFTGIGAGLTNAAVFPHSMLPTVGASGAIFGLLLAYGVLYPERKIYFWFIIGIPARLFVAIFGLFELMAGFAGGQRAGIAHFAHVGGLLFGLIYTWLWGLPGGRIGFLRRRRMARQRTNFQVIDFYDPDQRRRR
jgi:membrane associated rhomboid family serine protease